MLYRRHLTLLRQPVVAAGPSGPSLPGGIATAPTVWLDARQLVGAVHGAALAQFDDFSGNAHHGTTSGSPVYHSSVAALNNLPAILLDSTNDYIGNATLAAIGTGSFTAFAAIKLAGHKPNSPIIGLGRSLSNNQILYLSDTNEAGASNLKATLRGTDLWNSGLGINTTHGHVVAFRCNSTAASVWLDNGSPYTFSSTHNVQGNGYIVGAFEQNGGTFTHFLNGYVAQWIFYNTALIDADVAAVNADLKTIYGIA